MYRLGLSSRMAMFISPRSRKRKMAAGNKSEESVLEELIRVIHCLIGGARDCLAWV